MNTPTALFLGAIVFIGFTFGNLWLDKTLDAYQEVNAQKVSQYDIKRFCLELNAYASADYDKCVKELRESLRAKVLES